MTSMKSRWDTAIYNVQNGSLTFDIIICGRNRWALESLMEAGHAGCTSIDHPAPRWSAYIHNLRTLGVHIETIHEPHKGPFSGTHGRYVLRSVVSRPKGKEAAA